MNFNPNNIDADFLDEHLSFIDVRHLTRNSRKGWTVIQGVENDKKQDFINVLKKKFSCSGSLDENGHIKITGDHRREITPIIIAQLEISESRIRIH